MAKRKMRERSLGQTAIPGQKDIVEKSLEDYNDVFADIVNACLFHGKPEISEENLRDAKKKSVYEGARGLRTQERDVAKLWGDSRIQIAFLGFENQTEPERDMPLRIIGYDGAAYRDQLYKVKTENGTWHVNKNQRYPVITIILLMTDMERYIRYWQKRERSPNICAERWMKLKIGECKKECRRECRCPW